MMISTRIAHRCVLSVSALLVTLVAGLGTHGCGSQKVGPVVGDGAVGPDGGDGAVVSDGVVGPVVPPPPAGWDEAIRLPAALDRNPDPNVVEIDLVARLAPVEITAGILTELWTYDGGLPGPLIRVPVGARLIVHFTNQLPDATTIHWHGIRLPPEMDGVPDHSQPAVPTGDTFDYSFIVPDAGLFWYHPHVQSAKQVGNGLYGALLVEAIQATASHAASPATTSLDPPNLGPELVLVLSDIYLTADGKLGAHDVSGDLATLFGREGTVVLVNGRVGPTVLARRGQRQRWRVVNTAKSRYIQVAMAGHRFTRIGGDGGLIPIAIESEMLVLTPGERADVLVTPQGDPGADISVRWVPFNRGFGSTEFRAEINMFQVRLTDDEPIVDQPPRLPERLRTIAPLDVASATMVDMFLTQSTDVDGKLVLGINDLPSWEAPPLYARVGDTHIWTVRNTMDWDHPFHLHGFFFQVLDPETGLPPPVTEWKDTVNVPRQKTVIFAVKFDERPGMWMFHCHILDHAEAGMMGMVHLVP